MLVISLELLNQVDNMTINTTKFFCQQIIDAIKKKKLYFLFKYSTDLVDILDILQQTHYISGYKKSTTDNFVKIYLRYDIHGKPTLDQIIPVSSQKQRLTITMKQVKQYLNDFPYALAIIRTKIGIISIKTCWDLKIGGEFLFYLK